MDLEWIKWVFALIAVGVWVFNNILKNQQEAKPPVVPPRRPLDPLEAEEVLEAPRPAPKPQNEVEKFLEEVRRRKQAPPTQPKPVELAEPERPKPTLPEPRPQAPLPRPVVVETRRPTSLRPRVVEPIPVVEVVEDRVSKRPVPTAPTISSNKKKPTLVQQFVLQNLSSRHALASALLMREILDPPLSLRKRPSRG